MLDVNWEAVETADTHGGPVDGDVAKHIVLAGQEELDELLEGEALVAVGVEEGDKVVALGLTHVGDAVVAQEIADLDRGDGAARVAVDPLEGGEERKVADVAEALAGGLEIALAVTDDDEQVLQLLLRNVTERHVSCK